MWYHLEAPVSMAGKTESLFSLICAGFAHNFERKKEERHQIETSNRNFVVMEFFL